MRDADTEDHNHFAGSLPGNWRCKFQNSHIYQIFLTFFESFPGIWHQKWIGLVKITLSTDSFWKIPNNSWDISKDLQRGSNSFRLESSSSFSSRVDYFSSRVESSWVFYKWNENKEQRKKRKLDSTRLKKIQLDSIRLEKYLFNSTRLDSCRSMDISDFLK